MWGLVMFKNVAGRCGAGVSAVSPENKPFHINAACVIIQVVLSGPSHSQLEAAGLPLGPHSALPLAWGPSWVCSFCQPWGCRVGEGPCCHLTLTKSSVAWCLLQVPGCGTHCSLLARVWLEVIQPRFHWGSVAPALEVSFVMMACTPSSPGWLHRCAAGVDFPQEGHLDAC